MLNCASGAYDANTLINGGGLVLDTTDAIVASKSISFGPGGGIMDLYSKGTLSNKISGFGSGDIISLEDFTADKDKYDPSNGTLKLYNGNNPTPVETLHFRGSYNSLNFHLEQELVRHGCDLQSFRRIRRFGPGTNLQLGPALGVARASRAGGHRRARLSDRQRDAGPVERRARAWRVTNSAF